MKISGRKLRTERLSPAMRRAGSRLLVVLCLTLTRHAATLQLATAGNRGARGVWCAARAHVTAVRPRHITMAVQPPQFGRRQYWDDQYRQETNFSWYTGWEDVSGHPFEPGTSGLLSCLTPTLCPAQLQPFWEELVPDKAARVLVPGVGNDAATVSLYDDGWKQLTLFNYSPEGVRRAADLFCERPVDLRVADACALPYADAAFDAVLDKASSRHRHRHCRHRHCCHRRGQNRRGRCCHRRPGCLGLTGCECGAALRRGHWRRSTSTAAPTPRRAAASSRKRPRSSRGRCGPAAWC